MLLYMFINHSFSFLYSILLYEYVTFIYPVYYKLTIEYFPVEVITNDAVMNILCAGDTGIHTCGTAGSALFTYRSFVCNINTFKQRVNVR